MGERNLKLTVFVAGASVMVVEILASRMMSPYFGSSTYAWSSIIGVVLASLSLGYYVGGKKADRDPSPKQLSRILLISGVTVLALPLFKEIVLPLAYLVFGPLLGALAASLVLLAVPSYFLAMVSPYAIRLCTERVDKVGSTAGQLYAISTLGSIVGTISTGFVLIPYMELTKVFSLVSVSLIFCSFLMYRQSKGEGFDQKFMLVLAFGMLLFYGDPYLGNKELIHQHYTPYNRLRVEEDGGIRYMFLDNRATGAIDLDSGHSTYKYVHYFEIPFIIDSDIDEVLVVGEGTGVGPRQILEDHPDIHVTVSEIDPWVHEAAQKYFRVEESDHLKVVLEDVRAYILGADKKFDYVILDAYSGLHAIPTHLTTVEFFTSLKQKMNPDSILLMNIIGSVEGPNSKTFKAITKSANQEFEYLKVYPTRGAGGRVQNIIVIMSDTPMPSEDVLKSRAKPTKVFKKSQIRTLLDDELGEPVDFGDVPVLTDEKNPIELYYTKIR